MNHSTLHPITITIVYDNRAYRQNLEPDWGFACLIETEGAKLLFDTGADGALLLRNMSRLSIAPGSIDAVVISHAHADHTGGLNSLLEHRPDLQILFPGHLPSRLADELRKRGARTVSLETPQEIAPQILSTGALGRGISEQALLIRCDRGPVMITGCAHPGIVPMVRFSRDLVGASPLLVMGGFHLGGKGQSELAHIVSAFREELRVHYVGPAHCSGEAAMKAFRDAYGTGFIEMGAGRALAPEEL